ncbi:MAG: hypothetical protein M0019_08155 [Actinomycetota bacterium]|nr:hypothetical protein [Actinomycetota bacterium]
MDRGNLLKRELILGSALYEKLRGVDRHDLFRIRFLSVGYRDKFRRWRVVSEILRKEMRGLDEVYLCEGSTYVSLSV